MTGLLITGIAAGLASALLFVAAETGSLVSVLLFYLATLPLLISGLGWGWMTAVIGALVGAVAIGAVTSPIGGLVFFVTVGGPAAVLSYLALLSRTDENGATDWYPVGRIVLWSAAMGTVIVAAALFMIGSNIDEFRAALIAMFSEMATASEGGLAPDADTMEAFADSMLALLPPFAAGLWLMTTLLNLYIAGRVVRTSNRLVRPWPDIARLELPTVAGLVLLAALAFWIFGGPIGRIAAPAAASLILCFSFVGLGVVHVLTRGNPARGLILSALYILTALSLWPLLFLAALGLAEPQLRLRDRRPPTGGGPLSPT